MNDSIFCISDEERKELNIKLFADQTNTSGEKRKEYDLYVARSSMQSKDNNPKTEI